MGDGITDQFRKRRVKIYNDPSQCGFFGQFRKVPKQRI